MADTPSRDQRLNDRVVRDLGQCVDHEAPLSGTARRAQDRCECGDCAGVREGRQRLNRCWSFLLTSLTRT